MRCNTILFLALSFMAMCSHAEERDSFSASFAGRLSAARSLPRLQQDEALRTLAVEQARRNDPVSALRALSYVSAPQKLAQGLSDIRLLANSGSEAPSIPPAGPGTAGQAELAPVGGQGGSSLADFTSLMDLIQTTVVPDTWETLGGPSTMSPYVAGIVVDGAGVVQDAVVASEGTMLDNIDVLLDAGGGRAENPVIQVDGWRRAAPYRCVSLRRLSQEVLRRRITGQVVDPCIRHLAGLSRVQYVILDTDDRDVLLVGPVGGIVTRNGWMCDQKSGLATMQLEYFSTAAASIFAGQSFGCSIDPTQASLAAAAKVAAQIHRGETPIGLAAQQLREAIGDQDVRVFGTAGDTPLGYMMVEADRHMKQLALGLRPLPPGAFNYLHVVTRHLDQGPPDGQLLRLWFTASPMAARVDHSGLTFELAGRPLKLVSETTLAALDGDRRPAPDDFRLTEFVNGFNDRFDEIVSLHPIYGALQSVYASAAVAEIIRRSDGAAWLPGILGPLLLDDPSLGQMPTPRKVASIATLHRAVHRGKRHSIVVASGGVSINTRDTVEQNLRPYASLASTGDRFKAPAEPQWWWWDAK